MKMLHKLTRPRLIVWLALMALWVPVFVIYPVLTHKEGTARNMSVELVAEPYVQSEVLSYRWTGEIYRSCEISLRRHVVDSDGHVHTLVESHILPPLPRADLGLHKYVVDVQIGKNLSEGPAVYYVREVPRCTWLQRVWPVAVDYPPVRFNVTR